MGEASMITVLIMAGGKGTRFWPLSTEEKPKQFLSLISENTMIQMTVDRVKKIVPIERIFISTGEKYVNLIKEQIADIPEDNIIVEPEGRNTAPCILLSTLMIERKYKNSTIVVLPSDHLIKNENVFVETLLKANEFINDCNDSIITLGIEPNRIETGYGYIEKSNEKANLGNSDIIKVNKFVEKPDFVTAEKYIRSEKYLWNAGMFIWKSKKILELFKCYMNSTYNALKDIAILEESKLTEYISDNYYLTEATSIDYGIMEKINDIFVIPCNFGWDDIGSWTSVERYSKADLNGNVINHNSIMHNSTKNIIVSGKMVVFNNINDVVLVETDDVIFLSTKKDDQEVKNIINKIDYIK
jgi:mannose-1-phosphate guanylyltransferase